MEMFALDGIDQSLPCCQPVDVGYASYCSHGTADELKAGTRMVMDETEDDEEGDQSDNVGHLQLIKMCGMHVSVTLCTRDHLIFPESLGNLVHIHHFFSN